MSTQAPASTPARPATRRLGRASFAAAGEPMVWLTGGALVVAVAMIVGLIGVVVWFGLGTFWPGPVVRVRTHAGAVHLGEVTREETYRPAPEALAAAPAEARARVERADGVARRRLIRTGNFDLTGERFHWVSDFEVAEEDRPEWAVVLERQAWGPFYGTPVAFLEDGRAAAEGPADAWARFQGLHGEVRARDRERVRIERDDLGEVNRKLKEARLAVRRAERDGPADAPRAAEARARLEEVERWAEARGQEVDEALAALKRENARYALRMRTSDGQEVSVPVADVVRGFPANRLGLGGRLRVYLDRWWEFLTARPREANTEGGVYPAIWGTVAMTLLMSLAVLPFGVLAALYMREYAKPGPVVSAVRVAVNNLAGVPSIVFGVFGLGFFCYAVGVPIDRLFFPPELHGGPTYGKGGLLWASLTLALLTVPVVIVATEEALAAVPRSMREGSYACGASKWQTIWRIVLPRALPGIMTGMILAMARGAGEVAPLMLVGLVKKATELATDGVFPYVHPERGFLHLGFHIYDAGFQSPDSEAARPVVYTTTLLLIGIIAALNLAAVWLRARLRRRFVGGQF